MNLADTMEVLEGRELTPKEINSLHKFEQMFEIGEDDPLIVVLAMMAKNQLMSDALPERLLQASNETISLHKQTLGEQSTLIAKELIVTIGNLVAVSPLGHKLRLAQFAGCFMGGFIIGGLCVRLLLH